jgi:hypothetical protein
VNRCRWLSVCVCLLAPGLALAQPGPARAPDARQMYEDVEIMRRLLVRKLDAVAPLPAVPQEQWGQLRNFGSQFVPYLGPSSAPYQLPNPSIYSPQAAGQQTPLGTWGNGLGPYSGYIPWNEANYNVIYLQRPHDVEGVYVKGQGVVFTVTLPPPQHSPLPEPVKAEPKPPSDWDLARQQLHGAKPPAADKKRQRKEPTTADAILKVLADNGHHFGQLDAKESLTVVVTFRKGGDQPEQAAAGDPNAQKVTAQPQTTGPAKTGTGTTSDQGVTGSVVKGQDSSARDHELLGDLHLKQGKALDAVESYDKALKLLKEQVKSEPGAPGLAASLRALRIKLAQAQLTAGNVEAARKTLDLQIEGPGDRPQVTDKKPAALPAKLIIAAPKELLDLAGAGKISFEEFKKTATVDYLTFDAAEKKAGEK